MGPISAAQSCLQTGLGKDHTVTGPWRDHSRRAAWRVGHAASLLSLHCAVNGTNSHTSGVRMDGTTMFSAGHCQVKATRASAPLCAMENKSHQCVLSQNGEAGLLGEGLLPADHCAILHEARGCLYCSSAASAALSVTAGQRFYHRLCNHDLQLQLWAPSSPLLPQPKHRIALLRLWKG